MTVVSFENIKCNLCCFMTHKNLRFFQIEFINRLASHKMRMISYMYNHFDVII